MRHAILTTGNTCLKYSDFANLENQRIYGGKQVPLAKTSNIMKQWVGWEERFYDVFRGFRKGILA